jgi:hypothetical protein
LILGLLALLLVLVLWRANRRHAAA